MTCLEDLISVLTKYQKYDMIHSLTEWYEENCDSDYEPSEEDEPLEEYLEMNCETETLPRTKVDKKGFHELVFSDDEC